jgi:SAM-dependent methyltransferase
MNPLLNPLGHPTCLVPPKRLWPNSGWNEHVPFAMFLMDLMRPNTFVELGTHTGVSYCAFCQAVAASGLDTRCYAIDTWEGDEHAGMYGPEVLADLRAHHDPLYGAFSSLIQSTFDAARSGFADASIDLLHIDGYHTYEAVRRDFEGWLPKMRRSGIALLHDTAVRERDFGVWRLWDELSARYPHFSFTHGNGLGMLAVGDEPPAGVRALIEATDDEAAQLRNFFSVVGSRLSLQLRNETLGVQQQNVRDELATKSLEMDQLRRAFDEVQGNLEACLAQKSAELNRLLSTVHELEADLEATKGSIAFKMVQHYWTFRERVLPPGTRRGELYQSAKRALRRVALREPPAGREQAGPVAETTVASKVAAQSALENHPISGSLGDVLPYPSGRLMFSVGAPSLENFLVVADGWTQTVNRFIVRPSRVLDIGCGCGRTARFLVTNHLVTDYLGFDVIKANIDWCTRNITSRYPKARFLHVDLYSREYNPTATLTSRTFEFPVDDGSTDVVFAASVFTHLLFDDAASYLKQIARCLSSNGRAVVSTHHDRATPEQPFVGSEARIDVHDEFFVRMCRDAGLDVTERLGNVCGQETFALGHYS